MTDIKSSIVYIGDHQNVHDRKLVETLNEVYQVKEVYTENLNSFPVHSSFFYNSVLIVAGPLIDPIVAIPNDIDIPILGISHAFDINTDIELTIMKNIDRCSSIISDCRYITRILRERYQFHKTIVEFPFGCEFDYFSNISVRFEVIPNIIVTRKWDQIYRNDVIISALKILDEKEIEFKCTFIGGGPLLAQQMLAVDSFSKPDIFHFLGEQERSGIRNSLDKNWLYISASVSDGTSISLLEAMAAGLICITTNFPSNLEWIEHGKNGFVFEVNDPQELANLIEIVMSLKLDEKLEISRAARATVANRGNWTNNKRSLIAAALNTAKQV